MELNLTFQNNFSTAIPIDYQYYLSSWMYSVISQGDSQYASFLHDQGYKNNQNGKIFKLFSFSGLRLPEYVTDRTRNQFYIKGRDIHMKARFKVDHAIESFVMGLFRDQTLKLKNGYNSMASFDVTSVETKKVEISDDRAIIRAITPIVIGRRNENGTETYISPLDEDYNDLFINNLFDKYIASGGTLKSEWQNLSPSFKVLYPDYIKSKLTTIKNDTKQETKVKGWLFDFELVAPREIIEIGLLGGFGKECGMGFGFGEILK